MSLAERLRAFIGFDQGDFGTLALELYRWQRQHNGEYDAICAGFAEPARWQEIPPVPVGLFRELALTSFPVEQAKVTFRTSGTTVGQRGLCRALDTELYDLGARRHALACLGDLPRQGVAMVPYDDDSSLGHMCRDFVPGMPTFLTASGLDLAGAWSALGRARVPLFVPTTAFALDALLDAAPDHPVALPQGSIVMVTGGGKGRAMRRTEAELVAQTEAHLPGARVVGEYGMTELSSQLWSERPGRPYRPPAWLGVQALDPASGAPLSPGTEGLLSFVDLANRWTVLAIETQDLGVVEPDGGVRLLGRQAGAPIRGCSLTAAEAMDRSRGGDPPGGAG